MTLIPITLRKMRETWMLPKRGGAGKRPNAEGYSEAPTPAPAGKRLTRPPGKGLEGLKVERVPALRKGLGDEMVTRTNSYRELWSLLSAAGVGLAVMGAETQDPVLYAEALAAAKRLAEALVKHSGGHADEEGMPFRAQE